MLTHWLKLFIITSLPIQISDNIVVRAWTITGEMRSKPINKYTDLISHIWPVHAGTCTWICYICLLPQGNLRANHFKIWWITTAQTCRVCWKVSLPTWQACLRTLKVHTFISKGLGRLQPVFTVDSTYLLWVTIGWQKIVATALTVALSTQQVISMAGWSFVLFIANR